MIANSDLVDAKKADVTSSSDESERGDRKTKNRGISASLQI